MTWGQLGEGRHALMLQRLPAIVKPEPYSKGL
jgi:hypothetical protein